MNGSVGRPHECPEWDYLFISPEDPEFEACSCEFTRSEDRAAMLAAAPQPAQEGEK